jgi:hypothetical protein
MKEANLTERKMHLYFLLFQLIIKAFVYEKITCKDKKTMKEIVIPPLASCIFDTTELSRGRVYRAIQKLPEIIDWLNQSAGIALLVQSVEQECQRRGIEVNDFLTEDLIVVFEGSDTPLRMLLQTAKKNDDYYTDNFPSHRKLDRSVKEVGQRVNIGHPLYTNMLVTKEGVRVTGLSAMIPSLPELTGITAYVVEKDCKTTYKCGVCDADHIADILIGFEEYNMEFYINSELLIPETNGTNSETTLSQE